MPDPRPWYEAPDAVFDHIDDEPAPSDYDSQFGTDVYEREMDGRWGDA